MDSFYLVIFVGTPKRGSSTPPRYDEVIFPSTNLRLQNCNTPWLPENLYYVDLFEALGGNILCPHDTPFLLAGNPSNWRLCLRLGEWGGYLLYVKVASSTKWPCTSRTEAINWGLLRKASATPASTTVVDSLVISQGFWEEKTLFEAKISHLNGPFPTGKWIIFQASICPGQGWNISLITSRTRQDHKIPELMLPSSF